MTDKTELPDELGNPRDMEVEELIRLVRLGVDPESIAKKAGISLKKLELKLFLYPDLKAMWEEAEADWEIDNLQMAYDAAHHARAPLAVKIKYAQDNLKRRIFHAPATKPQQVVELKKEDLPEFNYAAHTPEELDAISRETNRESDDNQE